MSKKILIVEDDGNIRELLRLYLAVSYTHLVKNPTCIRCGRCVGVCPMHLTPVYMNMYAAKNDLEGCEEYDVLDCIECGSCAYVCPARIPLVQQFRVAKMRVQEKRRAEAAAAKAAAENK